MTMTRSLCCIALIFAGSAATAPPVSAEPAPTESRRMARAKDLIADEQWSLAVRELRAAAADPREPNKDEALFWLAHSQNQDNDIAAAIESIRQLEREHPSSRWVKPARSLLIELAQKLKRDDVLWWTAVAPRARTPQRVPPRPGPPGTPVPADAPPAVFALPPERTAQTPPPIAPPPAAAPVQPGAQPAPPIPSTPPPAWVMETWNPDADQRVLALGSLINGNEAIVVDLLRHIALDDENPGAGRRAVFVLAQSGKPVAESAVVEIAKRGPEQVKIAAVRELGRFGGPEVSKALLQVYSTANTVVKRQVLTSLGARAEVSALYRIAQVERDQALRSTAIVALGRVGGREQLVRLYSNAERGTKRPIIVGLFNGRAEDELIQIAEKERDPQLRSEVLSRLRLLGTPKARAYLAKAKQ
jgi:HEAT repeat protein